jgi:hypothetical protein
MADQEQAAQPTEIVAEEIKAETPAPDGAALTLEQAMAELTKVRTALKDVNAEAKKHRLDAQTQAKAKTDAENARLVEEGKYKELFEKQQAELTKAQADAKAATLRILRRDAASAAGLPVELADRLIGESEAELLADAKTMLAHLPKPAAPNINSSPGAGGAPKPGTPDDAAIAERANAYGVRPDLMKQQYAQ